MLIGDPVSLGTVQLCGFMSKSIGERADETPEGHCPSWGRRTGRSKGPKQQVGKQREQACVPIVCVGLEQGGEDEDCGVRP